MARTKASVGSKVSSGKSSKARCCVVAPSSSAGASGTSEKSSKGNSGGNPVCPRETPKWQRPITNFFICKDGDETKESDGEVNDDSAAGSSKLKPKRNVIQSDDEEILSQIPTNPVLDESLELEPLNGEDSHKIEEYYPTGSKGKGAGKKTKGKENRRDSKRGRDDDSSVENVSKKVKVN